MSRRRSVGPAHLEQTGTSPKASTATDPQHTMSSQQVSQPPAPVTQKPVVQTALQLLTQLKPHITNPYLDPGNWNKFHITCGVPLDLKWESSNGGDFLRLVTYEKMQQIASQYGFNSMRNLSPDPDHPFHNSSLVSSHLDGHIFSVYQNKFLSSQSRWYFRQPSDWENKSLRYLLPSEEKWMVEYISGVKDSNLPHINCTVVQVDKLQDDKLMFSEVWSILMLTLLFFHRFPESKCEVVPVTVVTISGTTFRIVQGFADGKKTNVKIRKSSVVSIGAEEENVKNQMMLILRWLLAEPIWPSKH
ncbi:hypothetical protein F5Y09DRAFT_309440 [Xylaria sp. FL1042]|nr:hypothetical protein F5Y09DRAFT_309440 [Xylaria sp. FL1042]